MEQAFVIMSRPILEEDLQGADVVIRPEIDISPLGSFDVKEHAINAGERAALAVVPEIRRMLGQWREPAARNLDAD